ncbi:MAG: hypothetical protein DME43_09785 [Verrucomicrobia bacterium]|nr:MAG: hypothetical protein DME43_09785 [Verrucomicrobiota bacterium]
MLRKIKEQPMPKNSIQTNGVEHPLETTAETAALARVSTRTLADLRNAGLPHIKISSRCFRYRWSEVEKWLRERQRVPF